MSFDWRNPERVAPWKPKQRFRVTPSGQEAAERYRDVVRAAQEGSDPRAELERAKGSWAVGLGLRPVDGILLEDLVGGRTSLAELRDTMDSVDLTLREARGILDRLIKAQLIEPLEPSETH
jgi:hypothetical protein